MHTTRDIQDWYNGFTKRQVATGINLRHYTIMNHLFRSGLRKNHSVLEIGCGIGTLTELLHKYLIRGKIVATDISDGSIEIARQRLKNPANIDFIVTDMREFSYPEQFDFIILPDVLEHIPIEDHQELFKNMSDHMHEHSTLVIHLPHPKALDFVRNHKPEELQIIDQSIAADSLLKDAYDNGLILVNYTSYSLFNKERDYVFVEFKKNNDTVLTPYSRFFISRKKFIERMRYLLARVV